MCVCVRVKEMKMSITHGRVLNTYSFYAMHFTCVYTFDTDTVIVLEALVHEEVSSKTFFKMFT